MATFNRDNHPLNQPVIERRYFVRVKFADFTDQDFSPAYNAQHMSVDHKISGRTATEALENAYRIFSPEGANSPWVRFEVYEEEVTVVRRMVISADRPAKFIRVIHKMKEAFQKKEQEAQVSETKTTDDTQGEVQPKRHRRRFLRR